MKYALLIVATVLFSGQAMAHPTTCVPPGTMVLNDVDGNDVIVNKLTREEKPFFATPTCHPIEGRNGMALGSNIIHSDLDGDNVPQLPPVITEPVVSVPLDDNSEVTTKTKERLPATLRVISANIPGNSGSNCGTFINEGRDMTVYCNRHQTWGEWLGWYSEDDSYYTPPFTLADLYEHCPALDKSFAARALPYYATNYSYFQLWRMEVNWNEQHDYEEACQIFSVPDKPIPTTIPIQ